MIYATPSDIALSWGAEYWKDSAADRDGTLDESAVERALLEASAEIDKPGANGQLSVSLRRAVCVDIAMYRLARGTHQHHKGIEKRYQGAVALLGESGGRSSASDAPTVLAQSRPRLFTRDTLRRG